MSLTINVHNDKGCKKVRIANSVSEIQKERNSKVKNQNQMSKAQEAKKKKLFHTKYCLLKNVQNDKGEEFCIANLV